MTGEKIEFMSAVLLVSKFAWRLADFYRDVLNLPLEEEQHGDSAKHYGCELGDLHFAIHPVENFPDNVWGTGSVNLAFNIFDLDAFLLRLKEHDIKPLNPPTEAWYGRSIALLDPDGNHIEVTQLSQKWMKLLEDRKGKGIDIVQRWKDSSKLTK